MEGIPVHANWEVADPKTPIDEIQNGRGPLVEISDQARQPNWELGYQAFCVLKPDMERRLKAKVKFRHKLNQRSIGNDGFTERGLLISVEVDECVKIHALCASLIDEVQCVPCPGVYVGAKF